MKAKVEFFKNLIVIAAADGQIDRHELILLSQKAENIGISERDYTRWISNADKLVLTIPVNPHERENLLIEMISVALADGHFGEEEFEICDRLANTLNYQGLASVLDHKVHVSHLRNLVLLAKADGEIDDYEMSVLQKVASGINVGEETLYQMIEESTDDQFFVPQDEEEKEKQLIQLLTISMADGEMCMSEYELCQKIAEKLGFSKRELDMILRLSYNQEIAPQKELKRA